MRHVAACISSSFSPSIVVLQRFQLEEHLIIHSHKHEMTLKIPAIKTDTVFTGEGQLKAQSGFLTHAIFNPSKVKLLRYAMNMLH